jgi:hypothetical protein
MHQDALLSSLGITPMQQGWFSGKADTISGKIQRIICRYLTLTN